MALWLNIHFRTKWLRVPVTKLYQIKKIVKLQIKIHKNTNVLKHIHLGIPRGKKITLFFLTTNNSTFNLTGA